MQDDTINTYNCKKYAYVTFLMFNNDYLPGSIVLADSLRKHGSIADIIILITNDITKENNDILKKFFDKIIKIEYIYINNNIKDLNNVRLTKLQSLKLISYEKIIILDSDIILLKNIDHLFLEKAPSFIKRYNGSSKINDGLLLIAPDIYKFNKLNKYIIKNKKKLTNQYNSLEYYLYNEYKFNELDHKYFNLDDYKDSYIYKFSKIKPFILENDISISERINHYDIQLWFGLYKQILNKNFELYENSILKQVNNLLKYFVNNISIYTINEVNINTNNNAINIYNLKKIDNIIYYHVNISKEYDDFCINYDTSDINFTNYIDMHKNNIYWIEKLNNIKNNISLKEFIKLNSHQIWFNILLSNYVIISNNINIILTINDNDIDNINNMTDNNIIYHNIIKIKGDILKNILFFINQKYVYNERIVYLKKYKDTYDYNINIYLYETIDQINFNNNSTNIITYSDLKTKIQVSSILLNNNSLELFKSKQINFIKNNNITNENLIKLLRFQSLKKWIFNLYTHNQINNIIIIVDDHNSYDIIDNNKYTIFEKKTLINNKIEFINVFLNNKISQNTIKHVFNNFNNPLFYYMIDGLKLYNK